MRASFAFPWQSSALDTVTARQAQPLVFLRCWRGLEGLADLFAQVFDGLAKTLNGASGFLKRTGQPGRVVLGAESIDLALQCRSLGGFPRVVELGDVGIEFFKSGLDFLFCFGPGLDRVGGNLALKTIEGFLGTVAGG